jgi:MFS family permease
MLGYLGFLRAHWKHLLFGVLLMALSSFGQTFFIALFGAKLRHAYALSDGGLGAAYAAATFGSALTLQRVGRWIDRTTVARYTIGVAALLGGACLLMALGRGLPLLVGTLYLLRLGGQGLMVHTALTATARAFPGQRGKALGISNLGMPVGEAILPLSVALGMGLIGWRAVWGVGAVVVVAGTALALACLPRQAAAVRAASHLAAVRDARRSRRLWRDPRVLFTLPSILAAPFIATGFFFHQARLLQEKGWAFDWWASCFIGYAIARAVSMVAVGPLIDRLGAVRVLPFFLVPLAVSMADVAFVRQAWGVPLCLIPIGISGGIAATLLTALWVELYGPERLAEVRSTVEAANVLASGTSPIIMGYLIDAGVPLAVQAGACLAYILGASWVARRVEAHSVALGSP